jgi:hypothetical protein
LIGLVQDGKTYILEGNRRLAALKLLLSPDGGPEKVQKRARLLSNRADRSSLSKVRVLIAPSRAAAAPLLMRRHTRDQVKSWAPFMQARFYRRFADQGMTVADMSKEYGTTPGQVLDFLRLDALYALACKMDLPDDVKDVVRNPREFKASALKRIMDVARARELVGIDFDSEGGITGKVDKDAFKKAFAKVLTDIAMNQEDTRTLNTADDINAYLEKIKAYLPDPKRQKGTFALSDFGGREEDDKASQPSSTNHKKPGSSKQRPSPSVIPSGVKCQLNSTRINDIFGELRRLRLDKNPNASAVLFRILLEMCVGHYLDKTKQIQPLLDKAKKDKKPNDWYPPLRHLLEATLRDTSIDIHPLARKKLNKFVSDPKSSLNLDGLDSYVHNRLSLPTAKDLRVYWETLEDLFKVVLVEPPPSAKAS